MAYVAEPYTEIPSSTANTLLQRDAQSKLASDKKKLEEQEQSQEQNLINSPKINLADTDTPQPMAQEVDLPMPSIETDVQPIQQSMQREQQAIAQGMAEEDAIYKKQMAEMERLKQESQKEIEIQKSMELEDKKIKNLQAEQARIKPQARDYFATKTSAEKVMAGIGLFLSAFSPQAMANAQKIVNDSIERDLDNQKALYNAKGGEIEQAKGNYRQYMDAYKDEKLARSMAKKDILERLSMDLEMRKQKTNSKVMLAQLEQGQQKLQLEANKLNAEMYESLKKKKQEEAEGKIPGYEGMIKDPIAARQFRETIADRSSVLSEIANLKKINEGFLGGALSPSATASAQQSQRMLIGKMRTALLGPGTVSESERAILEDVIADPTKWFSLSSSNRIKLDQLEKAYTQKINANAKALGLTPVGKNLGTYK